MVVFRRLHRALDRIDSTIDRNNSAFDRIDATIDRNNSAFDRNTRAFEDLQVVIRESRIREERTLQSFQLSLERMSDRHDAAMEDMRAEIRAQTQAIWRLLDRWGEGPAPAAS